MEAEKPSERIKIIREALGLTQSEFSDALNLRSTLLKSIEYQRQRVSEEVFAAIGKAMPELLPWVVYGGTVSKAQLRQSRSELCKLITARLDVGLVPDASFLEQPSGDQET